ncbi:MAG TPA: peptidoglycan editing factor PgeF [Patescibacteria group bacterium]|nr:peptidoglycan editing factor PgeF [Patescibacteria group bacterium]
MLSSVWQSPLLLPFPWLIHTTSTRIFGSLHYPNSDEIEDPFVENRRTFLKNIGVIPTSVTFSGNVHKRKIAFLDTAAPPYIPKTDGLITNVPARFLGVKTADCLPIFIIDPLRRTVGLFHAGWKGIAARMPYAAVKAFRLQKSNPADLIVAIGPSIGPCCYNIYGERVQDLHMAGAFEEDFLFRDKQIFVNLRSVAIRQLCKAGVLPGKIDVSAPCTSCHPDLFFSYHRTHHAEESLLSVIGIHP